MVRRRTLKPCGLRAGVAAACLALAFGAHPSCARAAAGAEQAAASAGRAWTLSDLVEIKRISGVAIRPGAQIGGYVVESPSLAEGASRFALFEAGPGRPPRKLLEAAFIADVAWRPGGDAWTVRADLGEGVQLYAVSGGQVKKLLVNPDTGLFGGSDGLVRDSVESPRPTGIVSYQWSPDGARLWYSRLRLRDKGQRQSILDKGVVYDDARMVGAEASDLERAVSYLGVELRCFDPTTGEDRLLAFAPSDSQNTDTFRLSYGSAVWVDPSTVQYRLRGVAQGSLTYSLWRVDVRTGAARELKNLTAEELYYSAPTPAGLITVRDAGAGRRLVETSLEGKVLQDFGPVTFSRIGFGNGFWRERGSREFITTVTYPDREGLAALSKGGRAARLAGISENLENCAFSDDLTFGLCVRESLTLPPELVAITGTRATIQVVDRPNAKLDAISPLHSVRAEWVNRYGSKNTGYITYPRDYRRGQRYPAIVVTHGSDAKNKFAYDGFQWEFPVQLWAERGYFVLSVNEPKPSLPPPYMAGAAPGSVDRQQFSEGLNSVASMEAAAQDLVKRGDVDPLKIGIAGYSRGAEISSLTLSQSRMFSAGSIGDDPWWSAGAFWTGSLFFRQTYRNLFGGSPFDPAAYPNYLKFSVSARAKDVAGPLLQQFTGYSAHSALELDQLLREYDVPTELVAYPLEAHLFYDPRHRASAMTRNLDWFDYWLQGRRDPSPDKADQYSRWDDMAKAWLARRAKEHP